MKSHKIFGVKPEVVRRSFTLFIAFVIFGTAVTLWGKLHDPTPANVPVFEHAILSIQRADGASFSYNIEVARTLEQELYGLMFRKYLPPDTGMIFIYTPDQPVSMWMKNTYIPLDMLFVRGDGIIAKIVENARPLDLTPIEAGEPIRGVIEINAGEVQKYGFKTGDKVLFSDFALAQ